MNEPAGVQPYEMPENTTPLSNPLGEVSDVDWSTPNIARIYDYHLGGAANFAVDRDAADEMQRVFPQVRSYAHANRGFLGRAVRTLVREYGLDQFLDLGSGVPTVGNVHEIAHYENPTARVAYVDWEAIACRHARGILGEHDTRVTVTQADVADPDTVLASTGLTGLLDFTRPVAVLACGILEILPDVDRHALMRRYRDACTPGSALVVSHTARLDITDEQWARLEEVMTTTSTPHARSVTADGLRAFLTSTQVIEPGVVPAAHWRPGEQPVPEQQARRGNVLAGVGLLPPTC